MSQKGPSPERPFYDEAAQAFRRSVASSAQGISSLRRSCSPLPTSPLLFLAGNIRSRKMKSGVSVLVSFARKRFTLLQYHFSDSIKNGFRIFSQIPEPALFNFVLRQKFAHIKDFSFAAATFSSSPCTATAMISFCFAPNSIRPMIPVPLADLVPLDMETKESYFAASFTSAPAFRESTPSGLFIV